MASLHVRSIVHRNSSEFYEFAIVFARVHSAASMVGDRGFNLCCSLRTQALASKSASWEHGAVVRHNRTYYSIFILCGEKSRSRIRWMKIFPRKVLPGSSGDELVGFFRCIDRLQYGLQKIRGPRPTTLSKNFYGCSVSSA